MRAFVTGAAGFIGLVVARKLRERGHEVVAAVRDPARANSLSALGVSLVRSDLSNRAELERQVQRSDAVFHIAGAYRVGIPENERAAMYDSNVGATERVLDAATSAGVPRIVYVSTVNVFGNTRGRIVDEAYHRDVGEGFVSWYDQTKYLAHEAAAARIAKGAPVVIAMPGGVYGRGDHSELGNQLKRAFEGRLLYVAMTDVGVNYAHVEDVAEGILLALERGAVGEAYVLGGQVGRLKDGIEVAARLGGHKPPRLTVPVRLLRAAAPLGPLLGRSLGVPPNIAEVISASDGVTYWASDAKARRELDYSPADLETGLRRTFGLA